MEIENNESEFEMGQEYFCPECNRNHTKGKIYKEHLKFFLKSDSEEGDVKKHEDGSEEENIQLEEPEIEGFDYDEEAELLEAFNELEEEKIDLEDGILQIKEKDECIKAVKSLPGVGDATLSKLIKAGFDSLEAIAYTPPKIIIDESGIGEKTTAKLIKASMEKLLVGKMESLIGWKLKEVVGEYIYRQTVA